MNFGNFTVGDLTPKGTPNLFQYPTKVIKKNVDRAHSTHKFLTLPNLSLCEGVR